MAAVELKWRFRILLVLVGSICYYFQTFQGTLSFRFSAQFNFIAENSYSKFTPSVVKTW